MPSKLAFIGCGAMGAPMAERLIDAGHSLRIYDPNAAAMSPLVARGAMAASSPCDAATGSDLAFACLPSPKVSRSVALEPADGHRPTSVAARLAGRSVAATLDVRGARAEVRFDADLAMSAGESLEVTLD